MIHVLHYVHESPPETGKLTKVWWRAGAYLAFSVGVQDKVQKISEGGLPKNEKQKGCWADKSPWWDVRGEEPWRGPVEGREPGVGRDLQGAGESQGSRRDQGRGGTVRSSWDRGEDGAGVTEAGGTWIGNDREAVLTGWEVVAGLAALAQGASWGS